MARTPETVKLTGMGESTIVLPRRCVSYGRLGRVSACLLRVWHGGWGEGGLRRPVPQPSEAGDQALRGCGISKKDSCVTEALSDFPDIGKFDKIQ